MDDKIIVEHVEGHPVELFIRDGEWWGRDQYGEFAMDTGMPEIPDDDDFTYKTCKAVVKFTQERYGEVRYCTGMAASNFGQESERCKQHRGRDNLMDLHKENFETGAFTHSYVTMFDKMPAHKRVVCIRMFRDFLEQSIYDFSTEDVLEVIDTEDAEWTDEEEIAVSFPVPTENTNRAKYLWVATLEFIKAENIEEQLFADAMANDTGVGEREVVVTVTDDGYEINDMAEHHLNLPLSRIIKDHKDLLKMGGVSMETSEEGAVTVTEREWVIDFDEPAPEANPENDPFEQNVEA